MKNIIFILTIYSCLFIMDVSIAKEVEGYISSKVVLFDGEYILDKGETINCTLKNESKCCFQEEFGEVCIDVEKISRDPVSKANIFFETIKYTTHSIKDICKNGSEISDNMPDSYIPQYSLTVKSTGDIYPVYIDIRLYFGDDNLRKLPSQSFSKKVFTTSNGTCHVINITKKDIINIINDHENIKEYLLLDYYTSSIKDTLKAKLIFNIFSSTNESDYANNVKSIDVLIPVDTEDNWPN